MTTTLLIVRVFIYVFIYSLLLTCIYVLHLMVSSVVFMSKTKTAGCDVLTPCSCVPVVGLILTEQWLQCGSLDAAGQRIRS